MRYNITFTLTKGKKTQKKFEVVESDLNYDKVAAVSHLRRKYPNERLSVLAIRPATTALSEIT